MSISSKQQNEEGTENSLPGKYAADLGVLHVVELYDVIKEP